jgi:hypothetical protein
MKCPDCGGNNASIDEYKATRLPSCGCETCEKKWKDTVAGKAMVDHVNKLYEEECTREIALKTVFSSFREMDSEAIGATLADLPLESMTTELIVAYGMATNANLGKDSQVRNAFCDMVLRYFRDSGMDRDAVISIFETEAPA